MEDLLDFKDQRIFALESQIDLLRKLNESYENELNALYNQLLNTDERKDFFNKS